MLNVSKEYDHTGGSGGGGDGDVTDKAVQQAIELGCQVRNI